MKHLFAILVATAAAAVSSAEKRPFELYQPIIDRAPFGRPPEGFDPTASPTASRAETDAAAGEGEIPLTEQQEQLQKSVNATALVVDSTRTIWIGFTDTTDPKAPRNHYVSVGSREDGWLVKDADPDGKTVTFEKDGVEIEVVIGKDGGKGQAPNAKGSAVAQDRQASARSPLLSRVRTQPDSDAPHSMRSLRQMRREREAEAARQAAEDREAREKALEEARRQREEDRKQRAEEEARREEERAAEREEYKERLKNLAADIERRMAENRAKAAENGETAESAEESEPAEE